MQPMVVRIRFARGPVVDRKRRRDHGIASLVAAFSALLTISAVMSLALGMWRMAADLKLTSSFFIPSGPLSDWRLWFAIAAGLQVASHYVNRIGKSKDTHAS
jgi:hypothetical protein